MKQLFLISPNEIFQCAIENGRIDGPLGDDAPVIVSNGVGTDSMAMLIELSKNGVVPDAVVTALVGYGEYGNEHRRFYSYLPVQEQWMMNAGFPQTQYVWYALKKKAKHYHYLSLMGNCLSNRTLPSISFRRTHSCSLKYKGQEIDRWVTERYGERPCYRLVGYDCTEGHRNTRFSTKTDRKGPRTNDVFLYPLQYWGFTRETCEDVIIDAGLPLPGKSSCYICASMKPEELDLLYPDELWAVVIVEAHAQVNLKVIDGLWGHHGRMTDYIVTRGLLPADLVAEVWAKWSAEERPSELRDNPDAVADRVLIEEARRLAAMSGFIMLPMVSGNGVT